MNRWTFGIGAGIAAVVALVVYYYRKPLSDAAKKAADTVSNALTGKLTPEQIATIANDEERANVAAGGTPGQARAEVTNYANMSAPLSYQWGDLDSRVVIYQDADSGEWSIFRFRQNGYTDQEIRDIIGNLSWWDWLKLSLQMGA